MRAYIETSESILSSSIKVMFLVLLGFMASSWRSIRNEKLRAREAVSSVCMYLMGENFTVFIKEI